MEHRRSPLKLLPLHTKRDPSGAESPRKKSRFDFIVASIRSQFSEKLEGFPYGAGWHTKLVLMVVALLTWEFMKAAFGMSAGMLALNSFQEGTIFSSTGRLTAELDMMRHKLGNQSQGLANQHSSLSEDKKKLLKHILGLEAQNERLERESKEAVIRASAFQEAYEREKERAAAAREMEIEFKGKQHELEQSKQELELRRQDLEHDPETDIETVDVSDLEKQLADALLELEAAKSALVESNTRLGRGLKGATTIPEVFAVDESQVKEDIWKMAGDVRFDVKQAKAVLYAKQPATARGTLIARPHPLKSEPLMLESRVSAIQLESTSVPANEAEMIQCTQAFNTPALVFSTGGYNGNNFHTFIEGVVPLFITAKHYDGEVVLLISDSQEWWLAKFEVLLQGLSKYPIVRVGKDDGILCFSDVTLGLRYHGNLHIDPERMSNHMNIFDLGQLLAKGFELPDASNQKRIKVGIVDRRPGSRIIRNQEELSSEATNRGMDVQIIDDTVFESLKETVRAFRWADVIIGVHGAGLTHMVFMRPETVLVQIVPFAVDWASDSAFGEPARKNGLHYLGYHVTVEETGLLEKYSPNDAVIANPSAIWEQGWSAGGDIYLREDVTLAAEGISDILNFVEEKLGRPQKCNGSTGFGCSIA